MSIPFPSRMLCPKCAQWFDYDPLCSRPQHTCGYRHLTLSEQAALDRAFWRSVKIVDEGSEDQP